MHNRTIVVVVCCCFQLTVQQLLLAQKSAQEVVTFPMLVFHRFVANLRIRKFTGQGAKLCEKRGQNRVRISNPFSGLCSIGTLSTGSKNGPIFGPAFWEAEYRHDRHFAARFWNREIWRRTKQAVPDAVR